MSYRQRLRRLSEKAKEGGVLIYQRDGSVRVFDTMYVYAEMFVAKRDLFRGVARDSEVLTAVRNATPASKAEFEEKFGPVSFSEYVIASSASGGWVDRYELTPEGRVMRIRYEGDSEEAKRIRECVRAGSANEMLEHLPCPPVAGRLMPATDDEDLLE